MASMIKKERRTISVAVAFSLLQKHIPWMSSLAEGEIPPSVVLRDAKVENTKGNTKCNKVWEIRLQLCHFTRTPDGLIQGRLLRCCLSAHRGEFTAYCVGIDGRELWFDRYMFALRAITKNPLCENTAALGNSRLRTLSPRKRPHQGSYKRIERKDVAATGIGNSKSSSGLITGRNTHDSASLPYAKED